MNARFVVVAAFFTAIVLVSGMSSARADVTEPSVLVLGALHGYPVGEGDSVNNLGHVAGTSNLGFVGNTVNREHAMFWSPETGLVDLGTLGGDLSFASDINDADTVVGSSSVADGSIHGFVWTPDTGMKDLGTANGVASFASAVNNEGIIGGSETLADGNSIAVVWEDSGFVELPSLPDSHFSSVSSLNDVGQFVGFSDTSYSIRPVLWDAEGIHDLGLLPGGMFGWAYDINNNGVVTGRMWIGGPFHVDAYRWTATGGFEELQGLGAGRDSAFTINEAGDVVGTSTTPDGYAHAVVWSGGSLIDLNDIGTGAFKCPQRESGGFGINDVGQVTGTSGVSQSGEAVLWTLPI